MSSAVQWLEHSLVLLFLGIGKRLTSSCPLATHCWLFQISRHIEWSTLNASSFRILNSFAGIPSPPLTLLAAVLLKPHLTSHSRMSGCNERLHHCDYLGHEDIFLYIFSVSFFHFFLVYSAVLNHKIPKSQSDLEKEEQNSRLWFLISNCIRKL